MNSSLLKFPFPVGPGLLWLAFVAFLHASLHASMIAIVSGCQPLESLSIHEGKASADNNPENAQG